MDLDEDLSFITSSNGVIQTEFLKNSNKDAVFQKNGIRPEHCKCSYGHFSEKCRHFGKISEDTIKTQPNKQDSQQIPTDLDIVKALNILKDMKPEKQQKLLSTIGQIAQNTEEELKTDEELKKMSPEERRKELKRRIHKKQEMSKMIQKSQSILTQKVFK